MNRTLTDPTLRTFRQPLAHRLRERIDALRDTIEAQHKDMRAKDRRINELEISLRKTERELADTRVRCHRAERLLLERG